MKMTANERTSLLSTPSPSPNLPIVNQLAEYWNKIRYLGGSAAPVPQARQVSGEVNAWWGAKLTFAWVGKLVAVSNHRSVDLNDFNLINPDRAAGVRSYRLRHELDRNVDAKRSMPLVRAIFTSYKTEIIWALCLYHAGKLSYTLQTVMTSWLLLYLTRLQRSEITAQSPSIYPYTGDLSQADYYRALAFMTLYLLLLTTREILCAHGSYRIQVIAGEIRSLLQVSIFEKSFTIAVDARRPMSVDSTLYDSTWTIVKRHIRAAFAGKPGKDYEQLSDDDENPDFRQSGVLWTDGTIQNAMTSESDRIQLCISLINDLVGVLYSLPVLLLLSAYFIGWTASIAIFMVPASVLYVWPVAIRSANTRKLSALITEKRVQFTSDLLRGIRFIKWYAWEGTILDRLALLRAREIKAVKVAVTSRGSLIIISIVSTRVPTVIVFCIYALLYDISDVVVVMPAVLLLERLCHDLQAGIPAMNAFTNAAYSLSIIEDYLLAADGDENWKTIDPGASIAIEMENAMFEWPVNILRKGDHKEEMHQHSLQAIEGSSQQPICCASGWKLAPLSIVVPRKSLTAIVGRTPSGKSSLLSALAGEMKNLGGSVSLISRPALAAQRPWIQSATARDNILMGLEYDEVRYQTVVHACALQDDFANFASGDATMFGEHGVNISGGQKARISLARAMYAESGLLLLDDPLSAVDSHTSSHIFEHAIIPASQTRAVVLVTHHTHILHRCTQVIWMEDGRIRDAGTYRQLVEKHPDFVASLGHQTTREHPEREPTVIKQQVAEKQPDSNIGTINVMINEERKQKKVPWSLYTWYISQSGGLVILFLLVLDTIFSQFFNQAYKLSFGWWTRSTISDKLWVNTAVVLFMVVAHFVTWSISYKKIIHFLTDQSGVVATKSFRGLLHAPTTFFDATPEGRIMNRFTGVGQLRHR